MKKLWELSPWKITTVLCLVPVSVAAVIDQFVHTNPVNRISVSQFLHGNKEFWQGPESTVIIMMAFFGILVLAGIHESEQYDKYKRQLLAKLEGPTSRKRQVQKAVFGVYSFQWFLRGLLGIAFSSAFTAVYLLLANLLDPDQWHSLLVYTAIASLTLILFSTLMPLLARLEARYETISKKRRSS